MVPHDLIYKKLGSSTRGDRAVQIFFNESERRKTFGWNVGATQGITGQQKNLVGINYGESTDETRADSSEKMSIRATRFGWNSWVTLRKDLVRLDPQFIAYVSNDSNFASPESYVRFFKMYGTHYPLSTLLGGKAYYEEKMDTTTAISSVMRAKTFSANATIPVQGLDFGFSGGVEESDKTTRSNKVSRGVATTDSIGGSAGASFDAWMLGNDTNSCVPIKVALRPIYDLIRPRLFNAQDQTTADKINARREEMKRKFEEYLHNRSQSVVEWAAPARPRFFSFKVEVSLREDSNNYDPGGNGPEVWGRADLLLSSGWGSDVTLWDNDSDGIRSYQQWRPGPLPLQQSETIVPVYPIAVRNGQQYVPDYRLGSRFVGFYMRLMDSDDFGYEHLPEIKLSYRCDENGGSFTKTHEVSSSGIGIVTVRITVAEVTVDYPRENDPYPKFPDFIRTDP
jgi:hypothetical protein